MIRVTVVEVEEDADEHRLLGQAILRKTPPHFTGEFSYSGEFVTERKFPSSPKAEVCAFRVGRNAHPFQLLKAALDELLK